MTAINREAERAVLAALMRDPDPSAIIRLGITPDLFAQDATREAFIAILAWILDGNRPDAATLRATLSDASLIEVETSLQEHASAANLPVWVKLLKDAERDRETQAARARLTRAAANGAPETELRAILDSVARASADETRPPRIQWDADFCRNDEAEDDLIDGYIPAHTVGLLFGDSQAYKSFLLIDIAGHVATGRPWRGRDVRQGKVVFIAGEGGRGLRARIAAWYEYHGAPMGNLAVSVVPLELCAPGNAEQLAGDIRQFVGQEPIALIVLDTLNTHFGPGDENATADMTRFRSAVTRLAQATGATVAIAHHCGHQERDRGRGSRSLYQGVDWEFKLERSGDFTTLTHTKAKDGPTQAPLSWQLIQQPLPWADKKGRPIDGALLVPADAPNASAGPAFLAGQPARALALLADLYRDRRANLIDGGHDPAQARVTLAEWQDAMRAICENRGSRNRIRATLLDGGHVRIEESFVYPVNFDH